jgi:ABC-type antimicrobial peptide transport system permease subunit
MIRNYLLTAFRNIRNNKGYVFINISGLSVGMACFIFILLWVQDELSYDKFHDNINELYRAVNYEQYSNGEEFRFSVNAPGLAKALQENYPEVQEISRYSSGRNKVIEYGDKRFNEKGLGFADPSFLKMFTFPFIKGNKENALSDPYSIVITEDIAEKYFGASDPVGKTLRVDNKVDFQVTGVLENIPSNSHFNFDFIAPFNSIKEFGLPIEGWNSYYCGTYVLLEKNTDYVAMNNKITHFVKDYDESSIVQLSLQPIKDIHLYSESLIESGNGDIQYVYIFCLIAGFVLLTACINFMNLSTARSGKRAKEVGLRKAIGAGRKEIIYQFYNESILMSLIALIFALLLVVSFMPLFNSISGKELEFNIFNNASISFMLLGTALVTGFISGSYPAFFLSAFQPVKVLSGNLSSGTRGNLFRKVLVSFQFVLTISLIIGTLIINNQLHYIRNQKLGYNKEQLISMPLKGDLNEKTDLLRNEFIKNEEVINVSAVSFLPSRIRASFIVDEWEGSNPDEQFLSHLLYSDYELENTIKFEMAAGRYYSKEFATDTSTGIVINEAAVKVMGMESPIGKKYLGLEIIGVIKDFHFRSLHSKISPLTVAFQPNRYNYLLLKIQSKDIAATIEHMNETWAAIVPEFPFEFEFLDDKIDAEYKSDYRIEDIINSFTALIIFIACLGLFGLASYTAERRTKEIGVRKVLGSSITNIVVLLTKEFSKWILISNIIAWPVAYYAMDNWLENFAYRANLDWWIFIGSGGIALLIALLTVSYQAIKAALANPVDSLRTE